MIVCICTGASEGDIRRAVEEGAASVTELSASGRAGQGCGACHSALLEILGRDTDGGWRGGIRSAAVRLPTIALASRSCDERRSP